jgi:ankyrin repeat protein
VRLRAIIGVLLLTAVAYGASVDLADAVLANDEPAVAAFLAKGSDVNAANRYGVTPLWLAATNGSSSVTRLLLKAGADVKAAMPHGETALMAAARTGEPETVKILLEAGADPNAKETSQGETALMWAAAENHPEAITALIKAGANPDVHAKGLDIAPWKWMQVGMVDTMLPRGGLTALMYAARQNAKDAAAALADNKADLNARDPDGATAIQFALINQHFDLAVLLIEKGADPNVADNTGMTSVYCAVDMNNYRSDIGRPARPLQDKATALDVLRVALQHGGNPNLQQIKAIIGRHHGGGDNSLGTGATALMRAAKSNDYESMRLLLEAKADPMLGLANGSNPLALLLATRLTPANTDKVLEMLRLMAKNGANLNVVTRGDTPLLTAAKAGNNVLVQALGDLGADLDAKDSSGKTALELVLEPGKNSHPDTATLLKELAAKRAAK